MQIIVAVSQMASLIFCFHKSLSLNNRPQSLFRDRFSTRARNHGTGSSTGEYSWRRLLFLPSPGLWAANNLVETLLQKLLTRRRVCKDIRVLNTIFPHGQFERLVT